MSAAAKLEALLQRVQENRLKPRVANTTTALIALPRVPEASVIVEEEDDGPIITTDVIDPSAYPDVLEVVTEEFEEAPTGETGLVPPTPVPSAPSSIPISMPPPPVSFRPGSPSPITTGSQAGPLPSAPPTIPPSSPPAAERIASLSVAPPSSPIARAISETRVSPMPATFGKLISRSLSLRPR